MQNSDKTQEGVWRSRAAMGRFLAGGLALGVAEAGPDVVCRVLDELERMYAEEQPDRSETGRCRFLTRAYRRAGTCLAREYRIPGDSPVLLEMYRREEQNTRKSQRKEGRPPPER